MDLTKARLLASESASESWPAGIGLRVQRALSWLEASSIDEGSRMHQFMSLWVALQAAHGQYKVETTTVHSRVDLETFLHDVVAHGDEQRINECLFENLTGTLEGFLSSSVTYRDYWRAVHQRMPEEEWRESFARRRQIIKRAFDNKDARGILTEIADRTAMLASQVYGGTSLWDDIALADSVADACQILSELVPVIIEVMMENPEQDWGGEYFVR